MCRVPELDGLRRGRSELENHYIDELAAGRLSRREFIRRGSAIGLSMPVMGAILAACGSSSKPAKTSPAPTAKKGGTLRVACPAPTTAINPLTVDGAGGVAMLQQTGEFLAIDNME